MRLRFTFDRMTPQEAAALLRFRVDAMREGKAYVRPHLRKVPDWEELDGAKRSERIARYRRRIGREVS
jgi:hypothetical protein